MFDTLPKSYQEAQPLSWEAYQPFVDDLLARPLSADNVDAWMADYSALIVITSEVANRVYVDHSIDTSNAEAEARYLNFFENIYPQLSVADQKLKEHLLASGLTPTGCERVLMRVQSTAAIFREANVPLEVELTKLGTEYDKVIGAQTVQWEGEERTIAQMMPLLMKADRPTREKLWGAVAARQLQDREAINEQWTRRVAIRKQIAQNAGESDYRAYVWKNLCRFDYTPQDAEQFCAAIEQVVVPATRRIYAQRRQALGLDSIRPWDGSYNWTIEPNDQTPLRPFSDINDLDGKAERIFQQVDPELGAQFTRMRQEGLLDLANRKGKAPGGYCTYFPVNKTPFIFMNAVGIHDDVQTLLHEAGHAFHAFASSALPFYQQQDAPIEFCEVASMAMELLAAPYLVEERGGYYTSAEAARARLQHLENALLFWPYMAVVDSLQHWVYTHIDEAADPIKVDAKWDELWQRFIPDIDYSGFEDVRATGWHRKLHIHHMPFYYIEYGLAQLGAVQVWGNALQDQSGALAAYRRGLALGGTASLPELFAAAGVKFATDASTLGAAVALMEREMATLRQAN